MSSQPKQKTTRLLKTCGTCLFLQNGKVEAFTSKCEERGILPTSPICSHYKPCPQKLTTSLSEAKSIDKFRQAMLGLSTSQLQIMAAFVDNERITRKHGWSFGQVVYIRFTGTASDNYMSNFLKATIVMADKAHVWAIGESGKTYLMLANEKGSDSLYTVSEFVPIRNAMVAAKKFQDPKLERINSAARIPTLDEVPEQRMNKRRVKKAGKRGEDDLIDMVMRLSRGVSVTSSRNTERKKLPSWNGGEIVMSSI